MSNILVATPVLSDAGTLKANTEVGSMPAVNLQRVQPRDVFQTPNDVPGYLTLDLGAAKSVDFFALLYNNADAATQWRVRGATSEANLTGAPGYDSGAMDLWPASGLGEWNRIHSFKYLAGGAQTFQWWRFDYSSITDYLRAGRLYVSAATQPTENMEQGFPLQYQDLSVVTETVGGTYVRQGKQRRRVSLSLPLRDQAEAIGTWLRLVRSLGKSNDLVFIVDPDEDTYPMDGIIYGRIDNPGKVIYDLFDAQRDGIQHNVNIDVVEWEHP